MNIFRHKPEFQPEPLTFSIKNGEVKYFGNLHTRLEQGENVFGIKMISSGIPIIADLHKRDIQVFEQQFPQFVGKMIIDTLPAGIWIKDGADVSALKASPTPEEK